QEQARVYTELLAERGLSEVQQASAGATRNHQTFGVLLPAGTARDALVETLRARGVETARLSYPLHTLPPLRESAERAASEGRTFPNATAIAERGLALPVWPGLLPEQQREVIATLCDVLK
ncbi:MAG TPA: DegT/DnrJ/EryC1/StrS family aminotransferase, partial [Polyangiales bacterium]|nr:DegT/DnrJ/EryC1/StrS family aminotransferase [Polyangiales bacterium]